MSDPASLRGITLFAGLSDADLATVAASCTVRTFEKQAQILGEQEQTTDLFFILDGTVRATSYTEAGREVIFNEFHAGEMIGEFSAIDGRPRSSSVIAVTDCKLARMTRDRFLQVLEGNGKLAVRLAQHLVGKIRQLSERVFEVSALAVRERIRRELLRLSKDGTEFRNGIVIRPAPTHYEIAARIGSHREAVTREFNRLEAAGIVEVRRRQLRIIDIGKLQASEDHGV
ncbi:MAG: Crp/Fnr family transcriptional regulator [Proteobacteria bacterium]|nr:Crp/Fnr family transcriptional regulator [Pseudomonadota bacterium]